MKTVLLLVLLSVLGVNHAVAQTTPVDTTNGRSYYILLKDGNHIHGRIIRQDSIMFVVKPRTGPVTFVEKALFQGISSTAPLSATDLTYYTQPNATGPDLTRTDLTRPDQTTLAPNQYVISLIDGTQLSGQVLSQDSSRVVIKTTTIGTVYVPADRVLRMERGSVAGTATNWQRQGNEAYPNLFPQYLNFTPTAYQAERGRIYYRNSIIWLNQFDVGITDNWSIGAGAFFFPLATFGWVSTKVSVPLGDRARIGVQGQLVGGVNTIFGRGFSTNFLQGLLSLGTSQNNITFGLGFNAGRGSSGQLLTVGIVRKVSPLVTFISENQLILGQSSETIAKLGGSIRFDRRQHSFDISVNVPATFSRYSDTPSLTLIPWVSYQVRLGR